MSLTVSNVNLLNEFVIKNTNNCLLLNENLVLNCSLVFVN